MKLSSLHSAAGSSASSSAIKLPVALAEFCDAQVEKQVRGGLGGDALSFERFLDFLSDTFRILQMRERELFLVWCEFYVSRRLLLGSSDEEGKSTFDAANGDEVFHDANAEEEKITALQEKNSSGERKDRSGELLLQEQRS